MLIGTAIAWWSWVPALSNSTSFLPAFSPETSKRYSFAVIFAAAEGSVALPALPETVTLEIPPWLDSLSSSSTK